MLHAKRVRRSKLCLSLSVLWFNATYCTVAVALLNISELILIGPVIRLMILPTSFADKVDIRLHRTPNRFINLLPCDHPLIQISKIHLRPTALLCNSKHSKFPSFEFYNVHNVLLYSTKLSNCICPDFQPIDLKWSLKA